MTGHTNALYELHGQSLKLAKKLMAAVEDLLPLPDTQNHRDQLFEYMLEKLKADKSYILEGCGLLSPAVRIKEEKFAQPRAYKEYPAIYMSEGKNPRFFMYSPIDYKGKHFVPKGAKALSGQEESHVGLMLFGGGWIDNYPIFALRKTGVNIPADFKPATEKPALRGPFGVAASPDTHTVRCYIAGGHSLALLKDMETRMKVYNDAITKVRDYAEAEIEKQFPDILAKLPAGEELYINESYREKSNKQDFSLNVSVRQSGKIDVMKGGQPVAVSDCEAFKLEKTPYQEYKVTPRTDTAAGIAFSQLIADIPVRPSTADYPALFADFCRHYSAEEKATGAQASVAPRAENMNPFTLLVYEIEDFITTRFCPPGATHLPTEAYHWLKADRADRSIGHIPPPMPEDIRQALRKVISEISPAATPAMKPKPAP